MGSNLFDTGGSSSSYSLSFLPPSGAGLKTFIPLVSDSSIPMIPWRGHFLMDIDASPPCGPLMHHYIFVAGSQVPRGGAASSFPS